MNELQVKCYYCGELVTNEETWIYIKQYLQNTSQSLDKLIVFCSQDCHRRKYGELK